MGKLLFTFSFGWRRVVRATHQDIIITMLILLKENMRVYVGGRFKDLIVLVPPDDGEDVRVADECRSFYSETHSTPVKILVIM